MLTGPLFLLRSPYQPEGDRVKSCNVFVRGFAVARRAASLLY